MLAYQEFSQRLTILRQLRNDESHASMNMTEQEVDAALRIVIDMYLFVTGMNITELEAAGYNADEMQRESTVIPVHSDRKSTRLNSSHANISYAVFCLTKKTTPTT